MLEEIIAKVISERVEPGTGKSRVSKVRLAWEFSYWPLLAKHVEVVDRLGRCLERGGGKEGWWASSGWGSARDEPRVKRWG